MSQPTRPSRKVALPPEVLSRCRTLRKDSTDAETFLWVFLRNKSLKDAKFRRQHPVGPYVLDLYCHEAMLAIELDGSGHLEDDQVQADEKRTKFLNENGIRVIRFFNNQVLNDIEGVLSAIWEELPEKPSSATPPEEGISRSR